MKDIYKHELLICECKNFEHQIIFSYSDDSEFKDEVYMSIHLRPRRGFFKRIWIGLKYIFGYKSRYGEFDEFVFQKEDAYKLHRIANHLTQTNESEYESLVWRAD